MSQHDSPGRRPSTSSAANLFPLGQYVRSRRGSLASITGSSQIDKEQLANALDQIHNSASQSETLTTFNEFASPPSGTAGEAKALSAESVQNGIAGLYNRFRGAVAGSRDRPGTGHSRGSVASTDSISFDTSNTATPSLRASTSSLARDTRDESRAAASPVIGSSNPASRLQSPTSQAFPRASDPQVQASKSVKPSISAQMPLPGVTPNRPSITAMGKATSSTVVVPAVAPVHASAFKEQNGASAVRHTARNSISSQLRNASVDSRDHSTHRKSSVMDQSIDSLSGFDTESQGDSTLEAAFSGIKDSSQLRRKEGRTSLTGTDGTGEARIESPSGVHGISPAISSLKASDAGRPSPPAPPRLIVPRESRRPELISRISQSHLPGYYHQSRASSTERSMTEASPIHTSAHNVIQHSSFSPEDSRSNSHLSPQRNHRMPGQRIPGTVASGGDPEGVSTRLEQMRKQVMSKEFWMADEICKECFLCGDAFSAFRRKHHCRTCGCIFDAKCTSTISGQRFGVQGSLRVCKTCLDIINRRDDSDDSDDSADGNVLPASFFQPFRSGAPQSVAPAEEPAAETGSINSEHPMPTATPMMAIPATRRIGDSTNRRSAVLEIDAPQLSRPGSSRSLKSLSGRPASSGHRRHHSKHNFLGRFKSVVEDRAPFQRNPAEDMSRRSKLPAFHDDNIIDPDLAPYMSDDGSSGDEQMSIFSRIDPQTPVSNMEADRSSAFGSMGGGRRHRARPGEKSLSGISFTTRAPDEGSLSGSVIGHTRPTRRRNLSAASNTMYHGRPSPRPKSSSNLARAIGIANVEEDMPIVIDPPSLPASPAPNPPNTMLRSVSIMEGPPPTIELNSASLQHVGRLFRQLLEDSGIPNVPAWEKALIPILLRCTDDVNPDVRRGDDIDIRHYVKLKKIPGGRPGDTSYVSGVVFTKNLALKSMPRNITNPRIVIVSFPIEYQRHQQHFMSLEPVIAQEKDFLRNMVNRIASLRPQILLVQKHVAGLALQYLAEAGIAVAYNVKQSVIEAVSRCCQTEIISSIDMVALKPVHVGRSAAFDVKTYVHNDIPGRKKTYIYLSGSPKELGCTIVLRGANMEVLHKMKRITEFMVYVVYNLKLETCLIRDEFISLPSSSTQSGTRSPTSHQGSQDLQASSIWLPRPELSSSTGKILDPVAEASARLQEMQNAQASDGVLPASQLEDAEKTPVNESHKELTDSQISTTTDALHGLSSVSVASFNTISAHESHTNEQQDDSVPEDVPMPTYYSDMVAKHQTKILSASPFVKFTPPYLLMRSREQERRLVYLKRLRDQDSFVEQSGSEKPKPQRFQLIKPEMVHNPVKGAPSQIMEVLHAVHDAEYDKALHNYQTHSRQWENYIQGNLNLFDPFAHQNIVTLYTVVCTETTIPCAGPEILALAFYNEHETSREFDPDCTLGQYVEDLCLSADTICTANGCERKMSEHHRTYVHGEARITVFAEKSGSKVKGLSDTVLMWSYCKVCQKETQVMPMSESTWKYSFGKYLELSFWSKGLHLSPNFCTHDLHRDHVRFFGYRNVQLRIHYDPIDLLEIVVPRTRITWKVDADLKLKNQIFTQTEERWTRFMISVKARIKGINVDSVIPEKVEACKTEVERLSRKAQEEHTAMIRKLQEKYMQSKYWEHVPLNRAVRAMQEKVAEWDATFTDFEANFFPSEKDIRRLAALQLRKMFMDRDESSTSIVTSETAETEGGEGDGEGDEPSEKEQGSEKVESEKVEGEGIELKPAPSCVSPEEAHEVLASVVEEENGGREETGEQGTDAAPTVEPTAASATGVPGGNPSTVDLEREGIQHLDLAIPTPSVTTPIIEVAPASTPNTEAVSEEGEKPATKESSKESSSEQDSSLQSSVIQSSGEQSVVVSEPAENQSQLELRRMSSQASGIDIIEKSQIPRPTGRGTTRKSGLSTSPVMARTQSQPAGTFRRLQSISGKSSKDGRTTPLTREMAAPSPIEWDGRSSAGESMKPDKKLSERLGLKTLNRKPGHSLIPRSIQRTTKNRKVSSLAKHFEELSREFEKERMRDRKQRANFTQSRAFPKASSKPIVEVYKDVNEAVAERGPSDEDLRETKPTQDNEHTTDTVEGMAATNTGDPGEHGPPSPTSTALTGTETVTEADTDADDQHPTASQAPSDDEGNSDLENSLLDNIDIPDADTLSSLEGHIDTPIELPKHEKSSLLKMLTNFWAERSASGWTQLDYPMSVQDHIFSDSDVIVREDEPSSLIAFALNSQDYRNKLEMSRRNGQAADRRKSGPKTPTAESMSTPVPDLCDDGIEQEEVETSLLRATGTHIKYQFNEGPAKMLCKIFYAEQFDAVRRKCGISERIVDSLSRCAKWDSRGGKTKSVFLKTLDDRLILKSLSPIETAAFLKFAPAYFNIMAEIMFHDLPSVIAKMLGFYQIFVKNPSTGTEIKLDFLLMENLFYDREPARIFDLKGSMRNRKIQSTGERHEVLLDENMVEYIYESPLFAREHSKKLLRASVWNDTLFLARQNVMDYSLMVAVDERRKEIVVGIIDCIRTYTWDKKLESWIKDRGLAGGGRNRPTVTSPKEYKSRFREAMARYVLQAPNCWHQFQPDSRALRAKNDGDERDVDASL